jgi:replicative DNA helicase
MSQQEIALRALCRKAQIDLTRLRTGRVDQVQLESLRRLHTEMQARPLYVEDNASLKPSELRARARRLKSQNGLGLLVVDYLQLMISEESREKKNDEVAALSRAMKLLAKELAIPVILVSQLNRNTEYRSDKRPTLSDLRDSGAIEQDADVVIFLYREETYKTVDPGESGQAELIVAKNRMGATDTVKLLFLGRRQTFATPAHQSQEEAT